MPSTEAEIRVTVKLYATLRDSAPESADPRSFPLALPTGATLGDLAARLGLSDAKWKVAFVNNVRSRDPARPLHNDDVVAFFPPIAGG
jgi:molybdopterin converting factor small subunit